MNGNRFTEYFTYIFDVYRYIFYIHTLQLKGGSIFLPLKLYFLNEDNVVIVRWIKKQQHKKNSVTKPFSKGNKNRFPKKAFLKILQMPK